jgi:hypothetical protein
LACSFFKPVKNFEWENKSDDNIEDSNKKQERRKERKKLRKRIVSVWTCLFWKLNSTYIVRTFFAHVFEKRGGKRLNCWHILYRHMHTPIVICFIEVS